MKALNEFLNEAKYNRKNKIVDKFLSKYPEKKIPNLWDNDFDFKKVLRDLSSKGVELEVVNYDDETQINFWDLDYDAPDGLIKQIKL